MDIIAPGLVMTEEHLAAAEMALSFALEVMRPAGAALDRKSDPAEVISRDSVIWDVYKKHRELGFHLGAIPKEMGGIKDDHRNALRIRIDKS